MNDSNPIRAASEAALAECPKGSTCHAVEGVVLNVALRNLGDGGDVGVLGVFV